ncbi:excalibur calcium-binding domain-containing protein [Nocardioides hwasunensis]|uniref:Excalibur calcium-binding domain-containing protein n=1 Tax=Nocardioides hwasunensis TaxID=397258 RepID=A0ABR8MJ98_9ACTN|nr:excalibur calcium-binding domain-containing protein [Nocardioides hwasunensis]MBD3915346.1 excalibur calcium-binding domain-containing protein [Nocardioides hwasunensis]
MRKKYVGAIASVVLGAPVLVLTVPAEAAVPSQWQNCTTVNQRLPHGVGRANARDRTSGTPVTNFRRDTALYNTAMRANRGLDRDGDGIACEKA